jgi:hypothetical protein
MQQSILLEELIFESKLAKDSKTVHQTEYQIC